MSETTNAAELKRQKINQAYEELRNAHTNIRPIEIEINEFVKGGFKCSYNELPLFMALNSYSEKKELPEDTINALLGQKIKVMVRDFVEDEFGKTVQISHRTFLEHEKWSKFQPGQIVTAPVKEILSFGLRLNVDGVSGFVHITNLSNRYIKDVNMFAKVGDMLTGEIISVNEKERKLDISLKKYTNKRTNDFFENYKVGDKIKGKAVRIVPAGVAFEITTDVEGFMPIREASWLIRKVNLNEMFKVDEEYDLEIVSIDTEKVSINLSYRNAQPDNWLEIANKYEVGSTYTGTVVFISPKNIGAEVILNDEISAFMPKRRALALYDNDKPIFKKGEEIQVKISEIVAQEHSMILESALKQERPVFEDRDKRDNDRRDRGYNWDRNKVSNNVPTSKPEIIKNLTFADLLSAKSKNILNN